MIESPFPSRAGTSDSPPLGGTKGVAHSQAMCAAHAVAERLRMPQDVDRLTRQARARLPSNIQSPRWHPAQLLVGHTGIAMLYSRLALDDASWGKTAHAHLSAALPFVTTDTVGDLLLSASLHSQSHGGYTNLLKRAAPAHASAVRVSLERISERLRVKGPGLAYPEYDLISGLARSGRSLMAGASLGHAESSDTLRDVLGLLAEMARPIQAHGERVPGWWINPRLDLVPEADKAAYPLGEFNLGIAHGICGPLSLLALAHHAGHGLPHTLDAMRSMADWVMRKRLVGEHGMYWPGRVSFEEETGRSEGAAAPVAPRSDWCYGTAGVARALHLAGRALGDPDLTKAGVDAMRSIFQRLYESAEMPDATFCHGRAGILLTAVRMAADTGALELWEGADRLARELARSFDPTTAFGYRYPLRPHANAPGLDEPGLLQGATGVALTLLSYADARCGSRLSPCTWDTALLMT
ncbi:lanthionine synthetase C family protein [Streptomyces rhizosphaericus]|uniref:Lanthionine synthetase C family protein n=1 Tax=Streptomyces rhizosphaericus TaxID=114699 RepID=A0A6G4AYK5_9ACTN|nr:lanthionine synthetase C family protein [Streptomyces rhizosphaericus]NEW77729.1 lanthionine synthetase C family protein [Streptomyces rhizosphaericus]